MTRAATLSRLIFAERRVSPIRADRERTLVLSALLLLVVMAAAGVTRYHCHWHGPFLMLAPVWFFGRFWTIFKAQLYGPHLRAGLVSLAVVLPVVVGLYLWNEMPETLTVVRMGGHLPAPVLDGDPSDVAWKDARAVAIRTVKGVNNPRGHVDVTAKGDPFRRRVGRPRRGAGVCATDVGRRVRRRY